jgi:hypothetical protein
LIRAVLYAIACIEKDPDRHNMLHRPNNKRLGNKVHWTAYNTGQYGEKDWGIAQIIRLERYFKYYQIMLIDQSYSLTNMPFYLNTIDKFEKYIYLLNSDKHYDVIESMASYLNKSYFCDLCKKGFDHPEEHNCISICKACNRMKCRLDFKLKCQNCDLFIQNKSCYDLHDETKC